MSLNPATATAIAAAPAASPERRDEFCARLMEATLGAFNLFSIYLGDRLGFYEVLAQDGPLTTAELAARTGTHERYVREWAEQQAVAGILDVDTNGVRRFFLPPGHDEVLADRDSLNYLAPLAQLVAGAVAPLPSVVRAYRTGGGVPYEHYGHDLREGQARMNRAMFLYQLGQEWLPAVPDVDARLRQGARVADIGCGYGWSSLGIARAYPLVAVDGFDLDAASIEMARLNGERSDVRGRVRFQQRDAADPEFAGLYDLVIALECLHDMSNPAGALSAMRRMARPDGAVIVVDERVEDEFRGAEARGLEWFMYGFSVLHCLPVGMAEQPSAGTGTVFRCSTMRHYAAEAGYREVEVLPIEHMLFRFYRLRW